MVDGFNFEGGVTANNVSELRSVLADMSQEDFSKFANEEKNDFANWIRDALRNGELADKIQTITNLDEFNKILDEFLAAEKKDTPEQKTDEPASEDKSEESKEESKSEESSDDKEEKKEEESSESESKEEPEKEKQDMEPKEELTEEPEKEKKELPEEFKNEPSEDSKKEEETESKETPVKDGELESEVKDLMAKNKEISNSIKDENKNLKSKPKFGHASRDRFNKHSMKFILLGFGFGFILGVIIMFVLAYMGVV